MCRLRILKLKVKMLLTYQKVCYSYLLPDYHRF